MKIKLLIIFSLLSLAVMPQQKPSLYLIGDSTMADKKDPNENPEHGWGQMLPELMTSGIKIENHAVNGRSSRSFINEGRWKTVRDKLKKGDFVIIQFGHNDEKFKDSTRYTNPFTQYYHNLEKFVTETREKGATPILMSSIVRRNFNNYGVLINSHGEYPLVARIVAQEMKAHFVDMQWFTERLEMKYGPKKSSQLHLHLKPGEDPYEPNGRDDDTHLSEKGAMLVASLALQEINRQKLGLSKYIKNEVLKHKILTAQ